LSDEELFENNEDDDRDCDRGPDDFEPTSDAHSGLLKGYDVTFEDDVPAAEDGHVSADLDSASGIVDTEMLTGASPFTPVVKPRA